MSCDWSCVRNQQNLISIVCSSVHCPARTHLYCQHALLGHVWLARCWYQWGARDMNRVCATTESQPLCAESTSLAGGRGEQSRRAGVGAPRRGQTESEGKKNKCNKPNRKVCTCVHRRIYIYIYVDSYTSAWATKTKYAMFTSSNTLTVTQANQVRYDIAWNTIQLNTTSRC